MIKHVFSIFLFIFAIQPIIAQKVTYNYLLDTSNVEVKEIQSLFENYIHSKPDSIYNNPYWANSEKESSGNFDILSGQFQPSLYMGFPIQVLSIKSKEDTFQIKAMFSYCNQGIPYVLAIANYYAFKENGEFKLHNALFVNRKEWNKTKIGWVTFYYPLYERFDSTKANELNNFVVNLCQNLEIEPTPFEYYFANDFDELLRLKGFDYWMGMGGEIKPTGISGNKRVFYSGMGENNLHEAFHVLVNASAKYNMSLWASEGIATFLGGSRGKPLNWHIKRTNSYLISHPEINLNNLLLLKTIDEFTDYRYAIGGFIAKKVYEKGGWSLLREFMNSGQSNEDYYAAIERYLGVKRNKLNQYFLDSTNKCNFLQTV